MFISFLGLDHQANVHKMKLLTVMSLAEDSSIISFETIQQQVQINAEQVEPFLLERKMYFVVNYIFNFKNNKFMHETSTCIIAKIILV